MRFNEATQQDFSTGSIKFSFTVAITESNECSLSFLCFRSNFGAA